jgi:hypothetical protein
VGQGGVYPSMIEGGHNIPGHSTIITKGVGHDRVEIITPVERSFLLELLDYRLLA